MKRVSLFAVVLLLAWADAATAQVKADRLKEGDKGVPDVSVKVLQVIDEGQMLVEFRDPKTNDAGAVVWLKAPTKGITDGKFWAAGQWKEVTGKETIAVTGTTTYKTASGASKTVFVVELGKK